MRMIRSVFIGFLVLFFSSQMVFAQVEKARLFLSGAYLTQTNEFSIEKGLQKLEVEVNALHLREGSQQAKVFGEGQLLGVELEKVFIKDDLSEEVKELKVQLEELMQEQVSVNDQINVQAKKIILLDSIVSFSSEQIPEDIQTNQLDMMKVKENFTFVETEYDAAYAKRRVLLQQQKELQKEIDLLTKKISQYQTSRDKQKWVLTVQFDSAKKQTVRVESSYLVPQASWNPLYHARVASDLQDVEMTLFAQVGQTTGMDWKNILLTISNVVPLQNSQLPSIYPWYLDIQHPAIFHQAKKSLQRVAENFAPAAMSADLMEEDAAPMQLAQVTELPLSFEYQLSERFDIPSQKKKNQIPLSTKKLEATFQYFAIPKMDSQTYLIGEVTPDEEMIPAMMNVYFDGRYIGDSRLNKVKAGDSFALNLGVERNVSVRHQKIKDDRKETTLFGKLDSATITRNLVYKITVENLKDEKIKIKVLDSLPHAKTDKIQVKELKISPEPQTTEYENKEGICLWEMTLKEKQKKEIDISFTITYPKDTPISGI